MQEQELKAGHLKIITTSCMHATTKAHTHTIKAKGAAEGGYEGLADHCNPHSEAKETHHENLR